MSIEVLWRLPGSAPASGKSPKLSILAATTCWLDFKIVGEDEISDHCSLILSGVESYRCTQPDSVSGELANAGDGKLLETQSSVWLAEIEVARREGGAAPIKRLRHLSIGVAAGPWYEFICTDFEARMRKSGPPTSRP